ncbi:hypothetical protein FRAAL5028 [Frankia alni ACN14a]|uniref:Uncharacterized protein n=1 Tax=Frankia alni (strain DSM 45986 / CECT 9034 / ACN14a) TaxID=326424 RepID=Q0RFS3_FRAAA|nr:hypothetical protein FRAAL5028 [Frankia alni ACN14a]
MGSAIKRTPAVRLSGAPERLVSPIGGRRASCTVSGPAFRCPKALTRRSVKPSTCGAPSRALS